MQKQRPTCKICSVHALCSEIIGGNNGGNDRRVSSCCSLVCKNDVIQCSSDVAEGLGFDLELLMRTSHKLSHPPIHPGTVNRTLSTKIQNKSDTATDIPTDTQTRH